MKTKYIELNCFGRYLIPFDKDGIAAVEKLMDALHIHSIYVSGHDSVEYFDNDTPLRVEVRSVEDGKIYPNEAEAMVRCQEITVSKEQEELEDLTNQALSEKERELAI